MYAIRLCLWYAFGKFRRRVAREHKRVGSQTHVAQHVAY